MKETTNEVSITGIAVSHTLETKEMDKKDEKGNSIGKELIIGGTVTVRTPDGSEHEVSFFSKKQKKDGNLNKIFSELEKVKDTLKTLENSPESPNIVSITSGQFNIRDYKDKTSGEVKSYVDVKSNFINILTNSEIEKTPQEAKFRIEGIVTSISPNIIKGEPTDDLKVDINIIGYENTIIPIVTIVPKQMVESFINAGFYEGGFSKLVGKLINTREVVTTVEKMTFGEDDIKIVTNIISRKEIVSGSPLNFPSDISEEEYIQSVAKRKMKLDSIKNAQITPPVAPISNNPFGASNVVSGTFNPFAARK